MKVSGELVWFSTSDGLELQGFLLEGKNPETIVVFIHGMGGSFLWKELLKSAKILVRNRISFFAINTRGAGIITRFYGKKKSYKIGMAFERFEDCVKDIKGAIDFAKRLGYKKIILAGHSTGCQKIIYFLNKIKEKSISGIALLSPTDDLNYNKQKFGRKFRSYLNYCRKLVKEGKGNKLIADKTGYFLSAKRFLSQNDPNAIESNILNYNVNRMKWIRNLPNIPILVVFAQNDRFLIKPTEFYMSKLLAEMRVEQYKIWTIEDSDHSFNKKWPSVFKEIIFYFSNKKARRKKMYRNTYETKKYVVKITKEKQRIISNVKGTLFFREKGFYTPKVIGIEKNRNHWKIYFEKICGQNIWEYGKLTPYLWRRILHFIREYISIAKRFKVTHGDLNFGNLLIDKNKRIYLIDFDHFNRHNLSLDLIKIYVDFLLFYYRKNNIPKTLLIEAWNVVKNGVIKERKWKNILVEQMKKVCRNEKELRGILSLVTEILG